ncbi:hypothetical protein [Mycobacterium sp. SM1]|uniref:hypothetical protein n=1 Tax=Mycobacterium sp. SM1 TaxID=2816243 RepID=UPI001F428381|nr:hypothetical protein [Mycobacterium sp. SM1]
MGLAFGTRNDRGNIGLQLVLYRLRCARHCRGSSLCLLSSVPRFLNILLGLVDYLNQIGLGGMQFVCSPQGLLSKVTVSFNPVLQRSFTPGLKRARSIDECAFHRCQNVADVVLDIQSIEQPVRCLGELHFVARPRRHTLRRPRTSQNRSRVLGGGHRHFTKSQGVQALRLRRQAIA